ncbi:uncharacterized protein [Asterias amurensis]|uniref:uncharacterized protein n=1 Tax=Asterias amurensis TaxID=7602 RepID=UPI003AB737AF
MAMMGRNSVMFCLLVVGTLFGGTNAGFSDVLNDNIDDVENTIHDALYPNENPLMQWGVGVFIAIIVGMVVGVVLICTCCCCCCYHCCCKPNPPPYTTLVVASNQPHPMPQTTHVTQMSMQPQQQPYEIKH